MKKNKFKDIFLGIIIGIIIDGFIGVTAITLSAEEITYTPSNNKFTVTNSKDALDRLYELTSYAEKHQTSLLAYYAWNYGSELMGANNPFNIPLVYSNDNFVSADKSTQIITAKENISFEGYITGYERSGGATLMVYKNNQLINTYSIGESAVSTKISKIDLQANDTVYFVYRNTTTNITSFSLVLYNA